MQLAFWKNDSVDAVPRIGAGAAAGLAGTILIHQLRTVTQKLAPGAMVPTRQDPGEFVVERAEERLPAAVREATPRAVEQGAAMATHFLYGASMGALYALLRPRPAGLFRARTLLVRDGAMLGVGVWALGYLGWLRALRLTPPVQRQSAQQVMVNVAQHALYGITTVVAFAAAARAIARR